MTRIHTQTMLFENCNTFETDNIDSTCTDEEVDEPSTKLEIENATK